MFNADSDDRLLEVLISAIVEFVFVFIFHLLSLILDIVIAALGFPDIFILASLGLLGRRSVPSANSVGASLRLDHPCADLILLLLVGALSALLVIPKDVWLRLGLFLLVLFQISIVTPHRYV